MYENDGEIDLSLYWSEGLFFSCQREKADEGLTATPGKRLISSIVSAIQRYNYLYLPRSAPTWELDTCEISNPFDRGVIP